MDEWINEMWFVYTMIYYLALENRKILTGATTWINLEGVIPSEVSQSQRDKCRMIPFS